MSLTVTNHDIFMMHTHNPNSPVVLGVQRKILHSSYFLECGLCPVDFLEGGWLLGLSFLVESNVPGFFPPGALVAFCLVLTKHIKKGFLNSVKRASLAE